MRCKRHFSAVLTALPQIYQQLQQQVIASQPADRQAQLSISLQGLMSDVQRNLEPKNRDKFTQVGSFCFKYGNVAT